MVRILVAPRSLLVCVVYFGVVGVLCQKCKPSCGPASLNRGIDQVGGGGAIVPQNRDCNFNAYPYSESLECTKGSWIIFLGGSVTCVLAHRTFGFFASGGLDTSYPGAKNITEEFHKHFDVVIKSGDPVPKEMREHSPNVDRSVSSEEIATRAVDFLEKASDTNVRSLKNKKVLVRLSFLHDRYQHAALVLANRLGQLRRGLEEKGLNKVFVILGPYGKWFELCEPLQVKKYPNWACPVNFLKKKSKEQVMQQFKEINTNMVKALVGAKKRKALTSSLVLSYKFFFAQAVQSAIDNVAANEADPYLLPIHQRQYFIYWKRRNATQNLAINPLPEDFESHPTGISAHWYWMLAMTAFCPIMDVSRCPVKPTFTRECSKNFIYNLNSNSLKRSAGTRTEKRWPTWQQSMEVPCKVLTTNYSTVNLDAPPPSPLITASDADSATATTTTTTRHDDLLLVPQQQQQQHHQQEQQQQQQQKQQQALGFIPETSATILIMFVLFIGLQQWRWTSVSAAADAQDRRFWSEAKQ